MKRRETNRRGTSNLLLLLTAIVVVDLWTISLRRPRRKIHSMNVENVCVVLRWNLKINRSKRREENARRLTSSMRSFLLLFRVEMFDLFFVVIIIFNDLRIVMIAVDRRRSFSTFLTHRCRCRRRRRCRVVERRGLNDLSNSRLQCSRRWFFVDHFSRAHLSD